MQASITFIPPDRGRACDGCTRCCEWLSAEAYGFKFGNGLPCTFLKGHGCGIYECRPNGCKAFQCQWKTELNIPEWLKPDQVNVIMAEERLSNFTYISVVYAGKPDKRVFEWFDEQSKLGINFLIWHTKETISTDMDFKNYIKIISKEYGV
jgi:Fe-S-cluster containining protein